MNRLLLLAALLCQAVAGYAGEWQVDTKAKENQVEFTSAVAGFSFSGTTGQIDGFIYWEGEELFAPNNQLLFEVELNSLDTGIGKRDRDLRKVLETDKWPKAVFTGRIVHHEPVDSTVAAYRVRARGTMSLHGVDREMELPGTLVVAEGSSKVTSDFTLKLADFEIEAPSLAAFIKVSQEIALKVSFYMNHVR
jgi:polyisoprenoid-binding protein YceI